jgi:hypothetical protein
MGSTYKTRESVGPGTRAEGLVEVDDALVVGTAADQSSHTAQVSTRCM